MEVNEQIKSKKRRYNRDDSNSKSKSSEVMPLIESATTFSTSNDGSRVKTSMFDYSIENHLKAMDFIYKLCGDSVNDFLVDAEIQRFSSIITFLSEWRYFIYNPRTIRFVSKTAHPNETEALNEITLSQFSAAMVPKCDIEAEKGPTSVLSMHSRKDFVLYVGGLVWSLDWCPKTNQATNSDARCEFIAVAAHPPDSTHHQIGSPLSGRGMIQIWCIVHTTTKEDTPPVGSVKRSYQKTKATENKPVRPRGRPRKNPVVNTLVPNPESQAAQSFVQVPETLSEAPPADDSMLSISASQELSAPMNMLGSEEGSSKQDKPGRRARKNAENKIPAEVLEGEFVPALAVRLPEGISSVLPADQNLPSDPVPRDKKQRKRKTINKEKVTRVDDAGIPSYKGQSFRVVPLEFPEASKNKSPAADDLLITPKPLRDTEKRHKSKRVLAMDMDCTLAVFRKRFKIKSKPCNNLDNDNSGLGTINLDEGPSIASGEESFLQKNTLVSGADVDNSLSNAGFGGGHVLKDVVLPRVVMCLGHDGKVAWDVKWRPTIDNESENNHRMGYLAVVLGNGSVEVWEIPSPQVVNSIYQTRRGKGTDPRFAKLKPVFRCSMLKYGDRQSMPLTVEWSASPPHDLILAGCHDGVVALWKFSADVSSEDAKPLLCFSADTGPIRSLTWAPYEGDPESSNIFVTAGHGGLKFWDLRDPFRPLWDAIPSQRFIYSLHWLPDPRCLLVSYDDGLLRMLSLSRAAYDVPVTGQPFSGTHQQGLHSYSCSSFAIWSIHISRLTGVAAYCCADGTVLYFQLTHKAVDKDPLRNRAPHFLCGSLASEEPVVTVNTQLPCTPHRMKKSATEWSNTPRPARTVASGSTHSKKTKKGTEKNQKPDDEVISLCDNGADTGNGGPNDVQSSAEGGKDKASKSKKVNDDQALICVPAADGKNTNENPEVKDESSVSVDVPPPKIVSMYKVRWNMNKGSERWLCYGGAAGIVRCQEIIPPVFDKKLLKR